MLYVTLLHGGAFEVERVPLTEHQLCLCLAHDSLVLVALVRHDDDGKIMAFLCCDLCARRQGILERVHVVTRVHDHEKIAAVDRKFSHGWKDEASRRVQDLKFDIDSFALDYPLVHVFNSRVVTLWEDVMYITLYES